MAGFILHNISNNTHKWPYSLARGTPSKEYLLGDFRLAVTETCNPAAARVYEFSDGVAWIEGTLLHKPERQGFRRWLNDSDGSFRGAFYSRETRCASVFTDPYGSRPVYYREKGSECAASDKVASLVNAGASVIDWNAILEAMALGTVVSQETSIEGIVQLPPGHIVALLGNGGTELIQYYISNVDDDYSSTNSMFTDMRSLSRLMRHIVADTWTDDRAVLFLSGGYDSRWMLNSAGQGKRTLTVAPGECREQAISRRVADSCKSAHNEFFTNEHKWPDMIRSSHLLTGAIYEPLKLLLNQAAEDQVAKGVADTFVLGLMYDTLRVMSSDSCG